jgi:translation initiation factor 2B subunit (eIF-2B alpha/beta/delta family)
MLEASSQRALLTCLGHKLTAAQSDLEIAEHDEAAGAHAVDQMRQKAQESDGKSARLRVTAVSLSKGVEQMKEVRKLQIDALSMKQRVDVLKEMCQQFRKQARKAQEKVCSWGLDFCIRCNSL